MSYKESQVQIGDHMGSLLEGGGLQGFHVWNDFALGVAKKMGHFAAVITRLVECSPESFNGSSVSMTNTIPQRIVCPDTFHFFHKFGVFFPLLRIDEFND